MISDRSRSELIGHRIRCLRKAHGITAKRLCELFSIDTSTLSTWETGKANVSIHNLLAISRYFGITVDQLIDGAALCPDDMRPGYVMDEQYGGQK